MVVDRFYPAQCSAAPFWCVAFLLFGARPDLRYRPVYRHHLCNPRDRGDRDRCALPCRHVLFGGHSGSGRSLDRPRSACSLQRGRGSGARSGLFCHRLGFGADHPSCGILSAATDRAGLDGACGGNRYSAHIRSRARQSARHHRARHASGGDDFSSAGHSRYSNRGLAGDLRLDGRHRAAGCLPSHAMVAEDLQACAAGHDQTPGRRSKTDCRSTWHWSRHPTY